LLWLETETFVAKTPRQGCVLLIFYSIDTNSVVDFVAMVAFESVDVIGIFSLWEAMGVAKR